MYLYVSEGQIKGELYQLVSPTPTELSLLVEQLMKLRSFDQCP